jgi:hypothetical protein
LDLSLIVFKKIHALRRITHLTHPFLFLRVKILKNKEKVRVYCGVGWGGLGWVMR